MVVISEFQNWFQVSVEKNLEELQAGVESVEVPIVLPTIPKGEIVGI
ncbi:hypothetical protein PS057_20540 [Yersinia pestis]|nr:hypothetical protein [Yersinia pestis]